MSSECALTLKTNAIHYTASELSLIQEEHSPKHIAVIMDGNRRWAKKQPFSKIMNPLKGHWVGAETLMTIVEAGVELGVKILTVYAFSTENWNRSPQELETLFHIFETFLDEYQNKILNQDVYFDVIGDLAPFSESLVKKIHALKHKSKNGQSIKLIVALNYGGRDEICRAFRQISHDLEKGDLKKNEINEALISRYLDTAQIGDPDLLIRTSGEMRISNFLLWQMAYAEVYITPVLWPDFTPRDLLNAVLEFQKRQRRIGR